MTGLTFAQSVRLERLPETTRVIGWNHVPPGPIVRADNGRLQIVKPDGRIVRVRGEVLA